MLKFKLGQWQEHFEDGIPVDLYSKIGRAIRIAGTEVRITVPAIDATDHDEIDLQTLAQFKALSKELVRVTSGGR